MECNKDEAIKAKERAEKKFKEKDLIGAITLAQKAQRLYPGLEGISQMIATFVVYTCERDESVGGPDWYGVLDVSSQADDETIRKKYRKLALALHPDKNKTIGAEGAFNLISQAWSTLSDKNRRSVYDVKRRCYASGRTTKISSETPPVQTKRNGANGFYDFAKSKTPKANDSTNSMPNGASSSSGATTKANRSTFWTICGRCRTQFEYLRDYLNCNLLCPSCRMPFFALEVPQSVSNGVRSSKPGSSTQHQQNSHQEMRKKSAAGVDSKIDDFQWIPFSGTGGAASVAQAANMVHQTYEKVKRVREEVQAARKKEKNLKRKSNASEKIVEKRRRAGDDMGFQTNQTTSIPFRRNDQMTTVQNVNNFNTTRELSQIELRDMLMTKARSEINKLLSKWKSDSGIGKAVFEEKFTETVEDKDQRSTNPEVNGDLHDKLARKTAATERGLLDKPIPGVSLSNGVDDIENRLSFPVADSDFCDFDKSRTIKVFEENQVWALYDNDDGMPRYYAIVHSVISQDPFRLRIRWLNSESNTEQNPLNLVGCGISKTCGNFRVGKYQTYDGLHSFSHKVRWSRGICGAICIFPRRGDVWALYRNWSPDWNETTADDVIHKYEMVEVLEDYDEKLGVVVVPLVKVAGFKAVFHRHLDPKQIRKIPKEEISQFSFQVPSYLISGLEASNAPRGCRELDPAALPLEFLRVIPDVKKEDITEYPVTLRGRTIDNTSEKLCGMNTSLENMTIMEDQT